MLICNKVMCTLFTKQGQNLLVWWRGGILCQYDKSMITKLLECWCNCIAVPVFTTKQIPMVKWKNRLTSRWPEVLSTCSMIQSWQKCPIYQSRSFCIRCKSLYSFLTTFTPKYKWKIMSRKLENVKWITHYHLYKNSLLVQIEYLSNSFTW